MRVLEFRQKVSCYYLAFLFVIFHLIVVAHRYYGAMKIFFSISMILMIFFPATVTGLVKDVRLNTTNLEVRILTAHVTT